MRAGCGGVPFDLNQPFAIVVERFQIRTINGMNRQPASARDVSQNPVAGDRIAATRQLHQDITIAFDLHNFVVGLPADRFVHDRFFMNCSLRTG